MREIFTIIRTAADADKGLFPAPSTEGSYLSHTSANAAMWALVEEEKETHDFHCSDEDYEEEYGDDFWEAYERGYAAANFLRFDILRSELKENPLPREAT